MERFIGRWISLVAMIIATMLLLVSCSDVFQMKQQELSKFSNKNEAAKSRSNKNPTVESECTAVCEQGLSILIVFVLIYDR